MSRRWFVAAAFVLATVLGARAESGKEDPKPVGKGADELLQKVTLDFANADLVWAANTMRLLSGVEVVVSQGAAGKAVTLKLEATLGEALRRIKDLAGCDYRVVDGKVQIATPEEFAAIDAGKAKFVPAPVSGKPEPQPVGDEAKLLLRKVTLELVDTPLYEACNFLTEFVKVKTEVSQGIAAKVVNLKLTNATVAEALRQIKDQAGGVHRVVDGKLLIGTAEEMAAIDAGKAKFTPYDPAAAKPAKAPAAKEGEKKVEAREGTEVRRKFIVNGKEYTLEQLKTEQPEMYEAVIKALEGFKTK